MKTLEGKVAVITGGSSGSGLATANRFVDKGAHVVITGRREKELKEAAASIKTNVTTVVSDVARLEDLDRACLDFCVLRHSMSTERDMYATQDDEESDSSIIGAAA
jgi:NADP-dependent 3-hydroxy acid dehydrogenase YdfG